LKDYFSEVQVEKVSDKIVTQLEVLIQEGKLSPGDKLPSERELIQILGVGRSSLREALNKLETKGYVEIKKRKGIYVKSLDSMLTFDPLRQIVREDREKLVQLYEVRGDIEQANAYQAALARNQDDLQEIRERLNDFALPGGGSNFSWQMDQDFHVAIARASHNFFRIHVVMSMFDFSREYIQPVMEDFAQAPDNLPVIIEQHQAIYRAIENQQADRAQAVMKEHLEWTQKKLMGLL
jgi:GntR family transcriptional repressor for pyruvate dehydrogenase complex